MKIFRHLIPLLLAATSAFGQLVPITQPLGNSYTDNTVPRRNGTASAMEGTLVAVTDSNGVNTFGLSTVSMAIAASTVSDGLLLTNPTAATSGNPRYSPFIEQGGFSYNSVGGSKAMTFRLGTRPQSNSGSTQAGVWTLQSSLDGGAWADALTVSPIGDVNITGAIGTPSFVTASTFESTVATGTAPFTVASTTLVTNLHAATADTANSTTTATNATNTAITDDTSTNATMYPTWVTTTTGNLPQKVSSTKMTFNPSTATLTVANVAGNASTATSATSATSATTATNATNGATVSTSTSASFFPLFAASSTNSNQPFNLGTGLTFNPNTNNLSTTTFTGALVGNASTATNATNSTNQAVTDDTSTNATMYPVWVTAATGNLPQKVSSTKLFYNPSTSLLTVTGNLTLGASTSAILGAAGNMTITAGTGNSRTMTLQTTTSGGTATNALVLNATQDATITGDLTVSGGDLTFGGSTLITGGAGNMQITAGTGASRQMTLRTTTSGSTATTALTLTSTQGATFAGIIDATSPNFTTSITTPSTTFALVNATATTVNAFGAATTVNTGASATQIWNFGGSTTASEFRFLEPSGSGTNYSAFKAVAQAGNITYSLPPTAVAGGVWTDVAGNGVLTSVVPAGSGTINSGATNTIPKYTASTTLDDSLLTDDGTTLGYTGTGGLSLNTGSTAGALALTQGTTQSTGTTNITIQAPAAVTSYIRTLPGAVGSTGFLLETVSGSVQTETLVSGTGSANVMRSTSPTLDAGAMTLAENASVALDPAGSADGKYSGITVTGTAGYTQAFGDLVYLDPTDSRWEAVDANSAAAADGDGRGMLGLVVSTGTDGTACTILLQGIIRADAKFPTFTINNPIYCSETAGSVTQTQPTTTDVVIRIIGAAITADEMYFAPDRTWITHT